MTTVSKKRSQLSSGGTRVSENGTSVPSEGTAVSKKGTPVSKKGTIVGSEGTEVGFEVGGGTSEVPPQVIYGSIRVRENPSLSVFPKFLLDWEILNKRIDEKALDS